MPIFEYQCEVCEKISEVIIIGSKDVPVCRFCNSRAMKKIVSAHASLSGPAKTNMPGPGDTACCGSSPGQASHCAGPGSCCGRNLT